MRIKILLLLLILTGCANNSSKQTSREQAKQLTQTEQLLSNAYTALSKGKPSDAIDLYLDKAINNCKEKQGDSKQRIYAARGGIDAIYYMLIAATKNESAVAQNSNCSDALYLKGYASIELGKIEQAQKYLKLALEMSPVNSMYRSELGHIYQLKQQWQKALDIFTEAESSAKSYSPENVKIKELTRAKRGMGYNLVELGRYDEAKAKYRECLALDKNDLGAKNELQYIAGLRPEE